MEKTQSFLSNLTAGENVGFIDTTPASLYISAASILFNPIFWNIVAQQEYRTHFLTRIFRSPYNGCYALAVTIFSLGIIRDYLYNNALDEQPIYPPVHQPLLGMALFGVGNVLVLSSMWALGVTGTYLGDYFGILMDEKVEGFPFNITSAPMYWGSTCSFVGTALYKGRVAGLVLSVGVFLMYLIALQFEDPFTAGIYAKREKERASKASTGKESRKKA